MGHAASDEHGLHVSSVEFNLRILASLIFLTFLTYATASMDLGYFDTPVALLIAFGKTTLVILYFMHVRWGSDYVKILSVTGFVFLIFLFAFTLVDVGSRAPEQPWGKYTWPGAAHRTTMIPSVPVVTGHGEHDAHGDEHHAPSSTHSPGHHEDKEAPGSHAQGH
ncbi:MAG: cytochrome C oxidase subunit IV family protein [Myxococcales bacterium]|nr:cytochrome C oxidase subunit IV family protein [Myxococcales bacterium]